jgi:hypothetical protein
MVRLPVLLLLVAIAAFPQARRRAQHAHEHGSAKLNIAVEGATAVVEWESPAEGVLGFEHDAKTAIQKKQQEAALQVLRTRVAEMVIFDASRGCKFTPKQVAVVREAGEDHSEVKGEFTVACAKPVGGSSLRFGVTKVFPRIRNVQVQILNGAQQTGLEVSGDRGLVALAP